MIPEASMVRAYRPPRAAGQQYSSQIRATRMRCIDDESLTVPFMGYLKSIDRATINGHEIDIHSDAWPGQIRLYVDGDLRDMTSSFGLRHVLTSNLDGNKLEVQIRQRLLSKGEAWAVWDGGHYRFREVE